MRMKKKIILVPYPAQGHVTPMLKLAVVLSKVGAFQPVMMTPEFIHRRISPRINAGILCHSIPDPDPDPDGAPRDFFAIQRAMEDYMPRVLEEYIRNDEAGVACVVADLLASWALDVARRCAVQPAGFWPAFNATYRLVAAIPQLLRNGVISENGCPRNLSDPIYLSSNEPILTAKELPWLIGSSQARVSRFKFWIRTLQRAKTLRYILTNSFIEESDCKIQQSAKRNTYESPQVLEIGPLIMQAATINSATFWEEDVSCLDWLDKQNVGSVMYISFGSWVSPIGEGKVNGLALTLETLGKPFIWVLGSTWRRGLPDGFDKRVSAYGRIVPWVPQLEVLQHQAVGCYLTHCGWNSTVEAIQCNKPLLCYPIAGDQYLNCAYIVNVWKIGVKIENFGTKEVQDGIREVMKNEEMRQKIERLNDKLFGKEGNSRAMTNLSTFIKDIGK